jgi:adenylate cyclase
MPEPDDVAPADALESTELDLSGLLERFEVSMLGGPRTYSRLQVSEAAAIEPDEARKLWRALGFANVDDDAIVFTDGDVAALRGAKFLAEHAAIDDELLTAMTRVLGQTFSRLAAWQGQLLIELVTSQPELLSTEDGVTEFLDQMLPVLEEIQGFVWRRQLVSYMSRLVSQATPEAIGAGAVQTVAGFADMAGFTALTRKASEHELRHVLDAFEAVTTDVVTAHNGRIVKSIGDEVLFVADSPAEGAEIGLDLHVAAAADPDVPPLRVGLAAGPVVSRLGDVYGSTVNIASRLTSISRPGWVLVDRIMAESLRTDTRYSLKSRRPESVRGYHHLRQWRLRRADEGGPDDEQST